VRTVAQVTGTANGSPSCPALSSAELGLDNSAYSAIVPRQVCALDRDVNSIAFAFALAALLQCAGNGAVKLGASEHVPRWIDSFRRVLAKCLNDRTLLLGVAARRMSVSPRTLQRLLEREGTTWRAEVEAVRRAQATRLLRGGFSKSQVARRLGYSDVRALRRAAKRWEERQRLRLAGMPRVAACGRRDLSYPPCVQFARVSTQWILWVVLENSGHIWWPTRSRSGAEARILAM